MNSLVSGATGYIGRHLCRRLLDRGDSVTALSKSGAMLPGGIPTLAINLAHTMPAPEQLVGVDVVYHLAGVAHQKAPAAAYSELNERATLRLARLAAASGVGCFVFLSSVKAMGPATSGTERSELMCAVPTDPYGLSKWRAEESLREEFVGGPMKVVILRPALVYGPAAKGNLALLSKGVRMGLPRPPALGSRSMVAVGDLVELMCLVGNDHSPGVHTWIVTDGEHYSTRFIYDQLRTVSGRSVGAGWLPVAGWRIAAALLDACSTNRRDSSFEKLFGTELYSSQAVLAETEWRPRIRLADMAAALMSAGDGA